MNLYDGIILIVIFILLNTIKEILLYKFMYNKNIFKDFLINDNESNKIINEVCNDSHHVTITDK